MEVAPSIRTSTRLPASADPAKFTVVFRRVRPRRSAGSVRLGAFDQHLLDETDALLVPFARDPLDDFDQALDAVALDLVGNLALHRGRLRACAWRVDEREGAVVAHLLDHLEGLTEVLFRLAGKADDDVGGQREIGDGGAHLLDEAQIALRA